MISRIASAVITQQIDTQQIDDITHSTISNIGHSPERPLTIAEIKNDQTPVSRLENAEYIHQVAKQKNDRVNSEELEQIKKIKLALNANSSLQKTLSELSDEELRLYFCHTYVESSHALDPLVAYNTKDLLTKMDNPDSDDNVNMLSAYAYMIALSNDIFSKNTVEDLPDKIEQAILNLYSILLTGSEGNITEIVDKQKTRFRVNAEEIDASESIVREIDEKRISAKIIDLGYSSNISFSARLDEAGIWFVANNFDNSAPADDENYKMLSYDEKRQFIKQRAIMAAKKSLKQISSKLADAILARDKLGIFKITTDLMYLHLFANSNGRTAQIIKDSLNLAMNLYPHKPLTHMSQYRYVITQPNEEHVFFMQKHSELILKNIKDGNAANLANRKLTDEFIQSYKNTENKQIATDISNYIKKISNYAQSA